MLAATASFEGLGQAAGCSIAAVRGIANTSPGFKAKLLGVADRLGTNADWLAAVMSFETQGTFSPSIRNPTSGAVGLIQFLDRAALQRIGTTKDALARMTAEQQLDYVEKYFEPHRGRLTSLCNVYFAVFSPDCMGRSLDYTVYRAGTAQYDQNASLDRDDDGEIQCREVCSTIQGIMTSRRIDTPCSAPSTTGGSRGRSGLPLLLGLLALGAAVVSFPRWRGAVRL